ncbi:hypothetical protein PAPYR_5265 [Paratrimastix pyriformis]|uniref:Uncharacterized protein n=1 Tax=Paratrimastix pyriformis TaxID=342808 RepID=A0ABQ8ULW5_9EUKA|nr:hypothetical protein PAPYR_5265 [Paratrimastix pyriformis]
MRRPPRFGGPLAEHMRRLAERVDASVAQHSRRVADLTRRLEAIRVDPTGGPCCDAPPLVVDIARGSQPPPPPPESRQDRVDTARGSQPPSSPAIPRIGSPPIASPPRAPFPVVIPAVDIAHRIAHITTPPSVDITVITTQAGITQLERAMAELRGQMGTVLTKHSDLSGRHEQLGQRYEQLQTVVRERSSVFVRLACKDASTHASTFRVLDIYVRMARTAPAEKVALTRQLDGLRANLQVLKDQITLRDHTIREQRYELEESRAQGHRHTSALRAQLVDCAATLHDLTRPTATAAPSSGGPDAFPPPRGDHRYPPRPAAGYATQASAVLLQRLAADGAAESGLRSWTTLPPVRVGL